MFFPHGDRNRPIVCKRPRFSRSSASLPRPVGAWLMGLYADRAGVARALILSVALMCLGSLTIAVTPSAASIGVWAAVILVFARIVQGLALVRTVWRRQRQLYERGGGQTPARLLVQLQLCVTLIGGRS